MKHLLITVFAVLAVFSLNAEDSSISLTGPSTTLRFDRSATLVNQGTKFSVVYIVNPESGQWELVWGENGWQDSWVKEYLQFDGRSDDVHNGGSLKILKPVSVCVAVFGDGATSANTTAKASVHWINPNPPVIEAKANPALLTVPIK